jgi:kynurenine formamidase
MQDAGENEKKALSGHLGTHFDVMDKEFPLEYTRLNGIAFDVTHVMNRDIDITDIDLSFVKRNMFIAFCSNYIERVEYGTKEYFTAHPELTERLIDGLLDKGISIIGIDFAGVRRGTQHTPKDQYCADRGVFIVENLCNIGLLLDGCSSKAFSAATYPINFSGWTGLPCRVIAELY